MRLAELERARSLSDQLERTRQYIGLISTKADEPNVRGGTATVQTFVVTPGLGKAKGATAQAICQETGIDLSALTNSLLEVLDDELSAREKEIVQILTAMGVRDE